ncbi:formylglycine-generating enzyme family protein [Altererythrobacter ishigakiensis]|nr:formylglycine-generating enzyme family protein [Altererythrobacter ishigakiensis]
MHKLVAVAAICGLAACNAPPSKDASAPTPTKASDFAAVVTCNQPSRTPVRIDGGTFVMGSNALYAEEGPERQTIVSGFWIDPHEVTNHQFAEFVDATAYVTVAEKPVDPAQFGVPVEQIPAFMLEPGSAVFTPPERPSSRYSDWWEYLPGANWRRPYGPDGPEAQPDQPVVHLAWDDMLAYAAWKGGRIPTEAEWEFAASAGAEKYTEQPDPRFANSWQGVFPVVNEGSDGFKGIAPVGCFEPNAYGLYDMVGNVWEVTADYFRPGHDPAEQDNPRGPSENAAYDPLNPGLASRVMKGGSYLCAPNYCQRYRPESRQGRDPGLGASNVGFRLAYDQPPEV